MYMNNDFWNACVHICLWLLIPRYAFPDKQSLWMVSKNAVWITNWQWKKAIYVSTKCRALTGCCVPGLPDLCSAGTHISSYMQDHPHTIIKKSLSNVWDFMGKNSHHIEWLLRMTLDQILSYCTELIKIKFLTMLFGHSIKLFVNKWQMINIDTGIIPAHTPEYYAEWETEWERGVDRGRESERQRERHRERQR